MILYFHCHCFLGRRHHQHHQQASDGHLDRHAEQQSGQLQVHLCRRFGGERGRRGSSKDQTTEAVQKTSAQNTAGVTGATEARGEDRNNHLFQSGHKFRQLQS